MWVLFGSNLQSFCNELLLLFANLPSIFHLWMQNTVLYNIKNQKRKSIFRGLKGYIIFNIYFLIFTNGVKNCAINYVLVIVIVLVFFSFLGQVSFSFYLISESSTYGHTWQKVLKDKSQMGNIFTKCQLQNLVGPFNYISTTSHIVRALPTT